MTWLTWNDKPDIGTPGSLVTASTIDSKYPVGIHEFIHDHKIPSTLEGHRALLWQHEIAIVISSTQVADEMSSRWLFVLTSTNALGWVPIYHVKQYEP
jgi:hypothetical protein